MKNLTLSNHPYLSGVTRSATIEKMEIDFVGRVLALTLKINHFIKDTLVAELSRKIMVSANNEDMIETPQGTMREFDYWELACGGMLIEDVIQGAISQLDENGLINIRCAYSPIQ